MSLVNMDPIEKIVEEEKITTTRQKFIFFYSADSSNFLQGQQSPHTVWWLYDSLISRTQQPQHAQHAQTARSALQKPSVPMARSAGDTRLSLSSVGFSLGSSSSSSSITNFGADDITTH